MDSYRFVLIDVFTEQRLAGNQGHGSALMRAVEEYAATLGYLLAYLETTSFQARPFYESLGYRVFGELVGIETRAAHSSFCKKN